MQLEAIVSHPIASYLEEEIDTCLTTASFQVVVESNKVPHRITKSHNGRGWKGPLWVI